MRASVIAGLFVLLVAAVASGVYLGIRWARPVNRPLSDREARRLRDGSAADQIGRFPFWSRRLSADEVLALIEACEQARTPEITITPDGKFGVGPRTLRFARPGAGQGVPVMIDALAAESKEWSARPHDD